MNDQKISYTIEEAVRATGMTRSRLYVVIGSGELRSFLSGRRRMVSARALEDFIAKKEQGGTRRSA